MISGLSAEAQGLTGMTAAELANVLKETAAPESFPTVDENLPVQHVCPRCKYSWSGSPS